MNDAAIGPGALPNLVVIGAMKCGTSALHALLDHHPEIAMSRPKELNFFFGGDGGARGADGGVSDDWMLGNWRRGLRWYAGHFPATARVRGESSPGYTSPDHPEAAGRMATVIPAARLVYLVRDPIDRAVSQYRHHHADGTERRDVATALLDADSQYLARSRYHERLVPFLQRFPPERILVLAQEDLRAAPTAVLRRVFAFAGVDETYRCDAFTAPTRRSPPAWPALDRGLRARLAEILRPDAERLRAVTGEPFPGWQV